MFASFELFLFKPLTLNSLDVTLWDFVQLSRNNRRQSSLFVHSIRKRSKFEKEKKQKLSHPDKLMGELVKELADLFVNGTTMVYNHFLTAMTGLVQDWPIPHPAIIQKRDSNTPIRVMLANVVGDCLSLFEVLMMRPSCCFACSASNGMAVV